MNKKWIAVIILAVIGLIAAFVAIEYLSQPISKVPHYLGGHHVRGHFKRRGEAAALVAVIALVGAAYLAYTITRKPLTASAAAPPATGAGPAAGSSTETLLSGSSAAPATTESAVPGEPSPSSSPDAPPAGG